MRNNLANQASRMTEVGPVMYEIKSNTSGSVEVDKYHAIRIRAVAGTTVTVDGVLACTMIANEIIVMNVGGGTPGDNKETVTVTFSGAVYAQVCQESERS